MHTSYLSFFYKTAIWGQRIYTLKCVIWRQKLPCDKILFTLYKAVFPRSNWKIGRLANFSHNQWLWWLWQISGVLWCTNNTRWAWDHQIIISIPIWMIISGCGRERLSSGECGRSGCSRISWQEPGGKGWNENALKIFWSNWKSIWTKARSQLWILWEQIKVYLLFSGTVLLSFSNFPILIQSSEKVGKQSLVEVDPMAEGVTAANTVSCWFFFFSR